MNHSESVAVVSTLYGSVASCLSIRLAVTLQQNFLVAVSWDCSIRCWEINTQTGESISTAVQSITGPVLDVAWSDVSIPYRKNLVSVYHDNFFIWSLK